MAPDKDLGRRAFLGSVSVAFVGAAGCTVADTDPPADTATPGSPTRTKTVQPTTAQTETATPEPTPAETETPAESPPPGSGDPDGWTGLAVGQPLDSFDSLDDQWTVVSGSATVSEKFAYDETAAYLTTQGSNRVRIRRVFDSSQDFTDTGFSMAVRLEGTTGPLIEPNLILEDIFGNRRLYSGSVRTTATDRWIRLDLGVKEDRGIDMRAINQVSVNLWDSDDVSRFFVDDIRTHDLPETGYVMFTFDDADSREYSVAFPTLEEHGFSGACFPQANHVTQRSDPSLSDYLEMQDHGWDIGGHTPDHENLANHSKREQRMILEKNKTWLVDNGFTHGARFFRTPYGAYDSDSLDVMPEFFDVSFIGAGSAKGVNFEVSDPRTVGFKSGDDYGRAKSLIDAAVNYKHLLGLTIHMGAMNDQSAFEDLVAHAAARERQGRLKVITPSTLLDDHIMG